MEEKSLEQRQADDHAIICLVLAIASFPLLCTLAGGVLTFGASVVLGILALKHGTSRMTQVIIGFVVDGIFALICIAVVLFLVLLNGASSVTVLETSLSPSGDYQVDIIANDDGATGGYYSAVVERASGGEFAIVGDDKPRDGEEIIEAAANWDSVYDITWISDDTFYMMPHYSTVTEIRVIRVELSEGGYSASEGYVTINREESYFDHFETDGDKVCYACSVNITNTFDEPIEFKLHANELRDKDGLLLDGLMIAVDGEGNEMIYSLDPGKTETFEVLFCGDKGPSDERAEDDRLPSITFGLV